MPDFHLHFGIQGHIFMLPDIFVLIWEFKIVSSLFVDFLRRKIDPDVPL